MIEPAKPRVVFACNMNSIRSPMAAAIARARLKGAIEADSCGLHPGYLDPSMVQVMADWGVDLSDHTPKTFEDLADRPIDVLVALTPEAFERAQLQYQAPVSVEFWPVPDPTADAGSLDRVYAAYRDVQSYLETKIIDRFAPGSTKRD
ncbi:MAG: low molecular weight phosphatase family protein [Maricaulaceae bacterium]